MSYFSERDLIKRFQTTLTFEIVREQMQMKNFKLKYNSKKYDVLDYKFILKLYKSTFSISESYFQLFSKNKVLVEIFIAINVLLKSKKFKKKSKVGISKKTLQKICGFKKTSIKLAVKKFLELGLIDKAIYVNFGLLKTLKNDLLVKGEKYLKIKGQNAWNIFLLYGLKTLKVYLISAWKAKRIKDKKFNFVKGRKLVFLQNNLFGFNKHSVYKFLKNIADFFWIEYKKMFGFEITCKKKFISFKNNKTNKVIHKMIGYEFSTKRFLLMNI